MEPKLLKDQDLWYDFAVLKYSDKKGTIFCSKVSEKSTLDTLLELRDKAHVNTIPQHNNTSLPRFENMQIIVTCNGQQQINTMEGEGNCGSVCDCITFTERLDGTTTYKGLCQSSSVIGKVYTENAGSIDFDILSVLANYVEREKDQLPEEAKSKKMFPRPILKVNFTPPLNTLGANDSPMLVSRLDVLEYITGTPLSDVFLLDIKPVIRSLLDQVHILHSAGVVHNDIAARNIIVTPDHQIRLIDFGESFTRDYCASAQCNSLEASFEYCTNYDFRNIVRLLREYTTFDGIDDIDGVSPIDYLEMAFGYRPPIITADHIITLLDDPRLHMRY